MGDAREHQEQGELRLPATELLGKITSDSELANVNPRDGRRAREAGPDSRGRESREPLPTA